MRVVTVRCLWPTSSQPLSETVSLSEPLAGAVPLSSPLLITLTASSCRPSSKNPKNSSASCWWPLCISLATRIHVFHAESRKYAKLTLICAKLLVLRMTSYKNSGTNGSPNASRSCAFKVEACAGEVAGPRTRNSHINMILASENISENPNWGKIGRFCY